LAERTYSSLDRLICAADDTLAVLFGRQAGTNRPDPAEGIVEGDLTPTEKNLSARLMRVNHVGEICAQALYQSQALTSRSERVRKTLSLAALEEQDHLRWCENRINSLGGRKSLLNPAWYLGSFVVGLAAGFAGDRINLGFLRETEKQVEGHLRSHLDRLPEKDLASRAVVDAMKEDEQQHGETAHQAGSADLPIPVKSLMRLASRVMTGTAHWI
jgi:ubiquinone biosynthesis monooxygenase Coq7|tara:strand:+ start:1072 stop:1716 length:645 start_codon:yes stop_codon:yes gene_type:complete